MAETTHSPEHLGANGWHRFWNAGGWWKALILAAAYYAIYELLGFLVGLAFPEGSPARGVEKGAMDVFIGTALPIILASIVLVLFALSIGWLKPLFARQTIRGRGWMWVAIAVVLVINVSSLLSTDVSKAGLPLVASWLFTGLFIGFAEEVLTRGFVVNLMRKAGHKEIAVGLMSAGVFAALHLGNLFTTDQGLATTLLQVVYTFAFGICMYLALRLTGNLIWPILLHASTDPSVFLHSEFPAAGNPLSLIAAFSTYLIIATGAVLLVVFIVSERRRAKRSILA